MSREGMDIKKPRFLRPGLLVANLGRTLQGVAPCKGEVDITGTVPAPCRFATGAQSRARDARPSDLRSSVPFYRPCVP